MTSRDGWQIEFTDPVDVMIRWVLREDAADGSPPPEVWERVRDRLMRQASYQQSVGAWRGFRIAARDAFLWLFDSPPSLAGDHAYCCAHGYQRLWESHLRLLVYQSDVPLLGQLV